MLSGLFGWVANVAPWLQVVIYIALIALGMFALIKGADLFVGGASNIAKLLKVPALIIGLTIVSIGTSLPELAVSVAGAIAGSADISIGNIVGSNIFNVLVVLGSSLVFVSILVDKGMLKRDLPVLIICGILLLVFALFGGGESGYVLSRIECGILFALFVVYLTVCIIQAKKDAKNQEVEASVEEKEENKQEKPKVWLSILLLLGGLACIVIGGDITVIGAKNIALKLGMSEMLVGLTIVAIGTSLPELVTSIVAAKKGENDIALGNVVGSCIFNILLILGVAGVITPLAVDAKAIIDIIVMLAIFVCFTIFALFRKKLPKYLGWIMLALYIAYFVYIILRDFVLIA